MLAEVLLGVVEEDRKGNLSGIAGRVPAREPRLTCQCDDGGFGSVKGGATRGGTRRGRHQSRLDAGDEEDVAADCVTFLLCTLLGRAALSVDAAVGGDLCSQVCPHEGHFAAHDRPSTVKPASRQARTCVRSPDHGPGACATARSSGSRCWLDDLIVARRPAEA
ncbi:hypothetical protein GCM10009609_43620 [Pseudonocardia aurantiaca]